MNAGATYHTPEHAPKVEEVNAQWRALVRRVWLVDGELPGRRDLVGNRHRLVLAALVTEAWRRAARGEPPTRELRVDVSLDELARAVPMITRAALRRAVHEVHGWVESVGAPDEPDRVVAFVLRLERGAT